MTATYFLFAAETALPALAGLSLRAEFEAPGVARRKCVRWEWSDEQRAALVEAGGVEAESLPENWRVGTSTFFSFPFDAAVPASVGSGDDVVLIGLTAERAGVANRRKGTSHRWTPEQRAALLAAGGVETPTIPSDWRPPVPP
jgi:hypothetical protein